ncbi:hypothetical protein RI129_001584 [Pyrocoelia pectoralis]|uniref:Probable proline--tRNA ligase, mitochondrial n=1 Tax=Pyrocoelia pectoralis TaxID=417401 RepID=A0AAN7ZK37_9COLE
MNLYQKTKSKLYINITNRLTNIFQPINVIPKDAQRKNQEIISKSHRLMLELGIIRQANPGSFHFLPLGVRALEKLLHLIDEEMLKIGAQKVILPTLTHSKLWKSTGRLQDFGSELFTVKDRHNQTYILSPTHEEAVSDLIASVSQMSYKEFPLKLYQTTNKYRDEIKPRFGLLRGRQFLMKDLYSFDVDVENARHSYEEVCDSYNNIFSRIGVPFYKAIGSVGAMGGSLSHEYHYKADIGEDQLISCSKCGFYANTDFGGSDKCSHCNSDNIDISTAIEVGHTFLLGDKYSKALMANYFNEKRRSVPLQMGSYGLGVSRILAAAIEVLSQEQEMRWPLLLAPYTVIIIPPKEGSKEEGVIHHLTEKVYALLETLPFLQNNILVDDRIQMTIGRRMIDARRVGYPFTIVIGSKCMEEKPIFELVDLQKNLTLNLYEEQLLLYLRDALKNVY